MKQSFYFYANPYQSKSIAAARALCQQVSLSGGKIYAEKWLNQLGVGEEAELSSLPPEIRAVVAFGGDGTLLRAVPEAARQGLPVLGIHTGTVGFLMAGNAAEPEKMAELLFREQYPIASHPLMQIVHDGRRYLALNDLSLTRGEHPGIIEVTIQADGETVFCAHGDGTIISTPLGATAYALSAGGPIVHPDIPCLMATPLCARELLLRPVLLPIEAQIFMTAHGRDRRRLQLAIDGQTLLPVTQDASVSLSLAPEQARLIVPGEHHFFNTLRKKQAIWNQQEEQE